MHKYKINYKNKNKCIFQLSEDKYVSKTNIQESYGAGSMGSTIEDLAKAKVLDLI